MKFEIITRNYIKQFRQKIINFFDAEFLKDTSVRIIGIVCAVLLLAVWLVAIFRFGFADYEVPIRYNSFLGVTELGGWYKLYRVPVFITLCFILNLILANVVYKKDKMISYIFLGINVFNAIAAMAVIINLSLISGN